MIRTVQKRSSSLIPSSLFPKRLYNVGAVASPLQATSRHFPGGRQEAQPVRRFYTRRAWGIPQIVHTFSLLGCMYDIRLSVGDRTAFFCSCTGGLAVSWQASVELRVENIISVAFLF